MGIKRKSRKNQSVSQAALGKPRGVIQDRVRQVGPEHFGIVAVDCAKARSKWMLCDFYGNVLIPPTEVEHQRTQLQLATVQLRDACQEHQLRDHVVAVEMTGTYHRLAQRAFRKAGSETRLVHPFASHYYRMPESPDVKTDDRDLAGIFRATVNGFGLLEPVWDDVYLQLQLLARHRRDLVHKRAKLQCQIRQYLERCLPGYAALFPDTDLWDRPLAMPLARKFATAAELLAAGVKGVTAWKQQEKLRCQARTIDRVVAWAGNAAEADPQSRHLARVWHALHDDWICKTQQITRVEQELAEILVKTPYLLLLSHPGIGVVSAAELGGELGPIEYYAHPNAITGRAGLFPSRYQSDRVDKDGPLARYRNARLRAACLRVADNLIKCNAHFHGKFQLWKQQHVDPRDIRCRVANRAMRGVFQIVMGRRLYHHPSRLDRGYVLDKLLTFHQDHKTPPHEILRDLQHAADMIPREEQTAEAEPLLARYQKTQRGRRQAAVPIGEIVLAVLARYGITEIECQESQGPHANESDTSHP